MKYLKRFNEELSPETYKSAAQKLTSMGDVERSNKLRKYTKEIESKELKKDYEKTIEKIKNNGKLNLYLGSLGQSLYHYFDFNVYPEDFIDKHKDEIKSFDIFENSLSFIFKLYPENISEFCDIRGVDINSILKIIKKQDYMLYINVDIIMHFDAKNNIYEIKSIYIDSPNIAIEDRKSGNIIKQKIINYLSENENLIESMASEVNLPIDYGFDVEDLIEYMKNYSTNKLYLSTHKNIK